MPCITDSEVVLGNRNGGPMVSHDRYTEPPPPARVGVLYRAILNVEEESGCAPRAGEGPVWGPVRMQGQSDGQVWLF